VPAGSPTAVICVIDFHKSAPYAVPALAPVIVSVDVLKSLFFTPVTVKEIPESSPLEVIETFLEYPSAKVTDPLEAKLPLITKLAFNPTAAAVDIVSLSIFTSPVTVVERAGELPSSSGLSLNIFNAYLPLVANFCLIKETIYRSS
jgi:hypothetical protein